MSADHTPDVDPPSPGAETDSADPPDTATPTRLHWLRRLLPVAFLVTVGVLATRELHALDLHTLHRVLQALTLPRLLTVQLIAFCGILAMGLYDGYVARVFGIPLPLTVLLRNSWIANAFNNLVGFSGLAGSGIRILLLGADGIDPRRATTFSALIMASIPVGLSVLVWCLLPFGGMGSLHLPAPAWILWLTVLAFAGYLPLYVLTLQRGMFTRLFRGLTPQSGSALFTLVVISTLDWILAATAAWAAVRFCGAAIPWTQFTSGFVLASALGILSLVPGGLGVFDTALVVLLAPFVPGTETLVSGILVYRLCYFLVPWLIAVYLGADRLMLPKYWQHTAFARQWRDSPLPKLLRLPLDILASLGVRALAYLTFAGGVVLLASAAIPALGDRLAVLDRFVPLAAIELSHLLSVATGVLLIALSRGIAEQVRSAYVLTQVLLVCGALLSFLKGIDFEEASILLAVALLLKRQRRRFYRESYPLLTPRSLLWLTGLLISVIGFAWLGDRVHGNVPFEWTYLTRFAPGLDAPRFARGLLIAAAVATGFIGWSFFRRPQAVHALPDARELEEATALLDRYGGSEFSHLLFLGDKFLLWSPDRRAFIQYGRIRDRLIALGDPCGDPESCNAAIIAFRELADRHDLTPCLYEVSETHVHRYHDAGFALFKLGEMAVVDLAAFTLAGKRGEALRHSVSRARREGAVFELFEQPPDAATWQQLRAVSDAWLQERGGAEKGFSLGNYNEDYLRRSPVAVVRVHERIVAFANLMPDYGPHAELSIDLMRHHPAAPPGTMDFLFVELIQNATARGYRFFNLGMSPLAGVGKTRYARAGERVARLAFEYGNRFYNYKGLRSFKEKFHPAWRSAYLAYPFLAPLPLLLIDSAALIAGGYRRIFFR